MLEQLAYLYLANNKVGHAADLKSAFCVKNKQISLEAFSNELFCMFHRAGNCVAFWIC